MKIDINKELEQAHKAQTEERDGLLYDLYTLNEALRYLYTQDKLTNEELNAFTEVIVRAYKYIKQGETI